MCLLWNAAHKAAARQKNYYSWAEKDDNIIKETLLIPQFFVHVWPRKWKKHLQYFRSTVFNKYEPRRISVEPGINQMLSMLQITRTAILCRLRISEASIMRLCGKKLRHIIYRSEQCKLDSTNALTKLKLIWFFLVQSTSKILLKRKYIWESDRNVIIVATNLILTGL